VILIFDEEKRPLTDCTLIMTKRQRCCTIYVGNRRLPVTETDIFHIVLTNDANVVALESIDGAKLASVAVAWLRFAFATFDASPAARIRPFAASTI
jgi:hypothetical protein